MTEFAQTNLQFFGELPSTRKPSVQDIITRILSDRAVFEKIAPAFINGGLCGHKVMDLKVAVDILRAADKHAEIETYRLSDFQLGNAIKQVMRSKYVLDKNWRITGINPKVEALLTSGA